MKRTIVPTVVSASALLLLFSGCSTDRDPSKQSDEAPPPKVDMTTPIDLTIYTSITSQESMFKHVIATTLKEAFPQFNIRLALPSKEMSLGNMVSAGEIPDIIWDSISGMKTTVLDLGLQADLTGMIQANKVDLKRFDPSTVSAMQQASGGKMYGLPDDMNPTLLFYNKDLFDKFGVPYPKDGRTWEQAYETAVKLTRKENDVQYHGMGLFYSFLLSSNQLSLPFIDPTADKAKLLTDEWTRTLNTYKQFYDIPGNRPDGTFTNFNGQLDSFYKSQNVGMVVAPLSGAGRFAQAKELNWDMAAAPTFQSHPKVGFQAGPRYYMVTNTAKKEQAFQVVLHLLSDEVQKLSNEEGRVSSLVSSNVRSVFGTKNDMYKNRNTAAIFYNNPAPSPANNDLAYSVALGDLNNEFLKVIEGKQDVNTALRVSEELLNKKIAEYKAK